MRFAHFTACIASALIIASAVPGGAQPNSHRAAADIDWPQFRFDDNHDGFNKSETAIGIQNVHSLRLDWQGQLGQLVLDSSPAVSGGVVYIASKEGTLWAYPADGCGSDICTAPLWRSTTIAQMVDSPTVANGVVYIGSQTDANNNDGKLNAFAAEGCGQAVCAPLWQGVMGSESILQSSPTVANGIVYVGSFDGKLYAFDAAGCGSALCQPLWTAQTGGSIESTPTVYKKMVFVGSDDGKLYAFKAKGCGKPSCKPKWTGALDSPIFSSTPAVYKGKVYIAGQHELAAFDAAGCGQKQCDPVWQASDGGEFFSASPAVANGILYIGWSTGLAAYSAKGCGQPVCDKKWILFGDGFQAAVLSSPAVANGVVYAGRNTGEVLAWNASKCGDIVCHNVWSGKTNTQIVSSSPAIVNGKLYIGSADDGFPENSKGRLYVWTLP
jgi:outer membrane protein assembly factor BamB